MRFIPLYSVLITLLMLTGKHNSFCQTSDSLSKKESYVLNANFIQGWIIDHSSKMSHLTNQKPFGLEIDLNKQTYGRREWQQLYNFPQIGVAFHYVHMNPNTPLGSILSLSAYLNPMIYRSPRFQVGYRLGFGTGYIEKRYHPVHNELNNLISSRLNFCLYGNINLKTIIIKNLHLNAGFGILHYSNGAFKVPNLGINIPTVHLGIGFGHHSGNFKKDSLSPYKKKYHLQVISGTGVKEVHPVGGPKFINYSLSTFGGRTLNKKSAVHAGIDVFYNNSYSTHTHNPDPESPRYKTTVAVVAGHELMIDRFSLLTQIGYYIYDPLSPETSMYQRVSSRYYLTKNFNLGVALKTHFANADFVEWGIGVRF